MKTDFMVISFSDTGEVSAMHRDNFDLGFLGNQKIERASEIIFNETTQLWDIYLMKGPGIRLPYLTNHAKGFPTYKAARDIEIAWLEKAALLDVDPVSDKGIEQLLILRTLARV